MKDEIKERIKKFKEYLATGKRHHWRCLNPHYVEDMANILITEIESLDEKNQKQKEIIKIECTKAAKYETLWEQQEDKFKQLQAVCNCVKDINIPYLYHRLRTQIDIRDIRQHNELIVSLLKLKQALSGLEKK